MSLSTHFTLEEFTSSDTAVRLGIDNSLPESLMVEASKTADMMERIRAYLSERAAKQIPVIVTSGYRCQALNRAIGSKDSSDHIRMLAIDFKAPAFGTPFKVCAALVPVMDILGIGQIIYEHTWIHVSTRIPDKLLNRVLTVKSGGYVTGIVGD
jgi:hypothetical protein